MISPRVTRSTTSRTSCSAKSNGVPVLVKDVAQVRVGHVPRLGIAASDNDDDVVAAIVVMSRTEQDRRGAAAVKAEIARMNQRRQPAAGGEGACRSTTAAH